MIINISRHVLWCVCFPVQNMPHSGFSVVHASFLQPFTAIVLDSVLCFEFWPWIFGSSKRGLFFHCKVQTFWKLCWNHFQIYFYQCLCGCSLAPMNRWTARSWTSGCWSTVPTCSVMFYNYKNHHCLCAFSPTRSAVFYRTLLHQCLCVCSLALMNRWTARSWTSGCWSTVPTCSVAFTAGSAWCWAGATCLLKW